MDESIAEDINLPRFEDFYRGKSVFVTGTTGFLGTVLLESLLRCCPEIKSIYILLRPKQNEQPEVRKAQIFDKKIFEKLKGETPDFLQKVHMIAGDATLPKLGMKDEDVQLLIQEVSVVFHCAAVVNFIKPLQFTLMNNVMSVNSVIELCRQMKKFEVLVYTSTAYSNTNILNITIKEEIYRLPVRSEKFLDALKNDDNEKLDELVARCKPDWPNSYTFSKCLAENVIMDTASDLPVAIIRPSVIINTYKHPIPGYVEGSSGLIAIALGMGKGIIKVMCADPQVKINLVPADIVANAHVLAAWSVGTKRSATPLVVNCTASENIHITVRKQTDSLLEMVREFPIPRSFEQPQRVILVPNKYLYYILAAYYHYLPSIVLDGMLNILGKKPRLYSSYRFIDKIMSCTHFFCLFSFEYERKNIEFLDKLTHLENRKDLTLDFKDANLLQMTSSTPQSCPFYDWKIDKKSRSERQRIMYKRHILIVCIQRMFLVACCLFIYWAFSMIFR